MKLNIQASLVAAIAKFKAVRDIRYYLNGVFVEPLESGGALITATNGHVMGMWRDPTAEVERPAILRIGGKLEAACAGADTKRLTIIENRLVVVDKLGYELHVQHKEGGRDMNWEVEGKFPDVSKVIPEEHKEASMHNCVNPEYVALVDRALDIGFGAKGRGVVFRQKTENASIAVTCSATPDFFCVIMPMKQDTSASYPRWLLDLLPAKEVQPDAVKPKADAANDAEATALKVAAGGAP